MLEHELKKSEKYIGFLTQECNRLKQEQFENKNIQDIQSMYPR